MATSYEEDDEDEAQSLVVDNGTKMIKAGFGGDDAPRAVFPNIVGRPRHVPGIMMGMAQRDAYVGDEAQTRRGILKYRMPIEHGIIVNWDDMEKIWHHVFYNELRVAPEEHPVLMTHSVDASLPNYEKQTQIMFETFNVPALYLEGQSVLSMYASGKLTGCVVKSGANTLCVPVYQGHALKTSMKRLDIGGRDCTDYLMKILAERGYSFTTTAEREIVRDIKEKLGFVAVDYDSELKNASTHEKTYELPDGQCIVFDSQRFRCAEIMFNPSLLGKHECGVSQLVYESVMSLKDAALETSMFGNIVLSGGNTVFAGFDERLKHDLKKRFDVDCNVKASPERKYSAWIGGSIMSSLSTFSQLCLTKDQYDEIGPSRIHFHCF